MEQVVEGTAIPLHDSRAAVNQLLHSVPLFPADNRFMAVLDNLPFITGNFVDGVGADGLLTAFAHHMIALNICISFLIFG